MRPSNGKEQQMDGGHITKEMPKRSLQADKIYKLLCDGKIFEAKMEALSLRATLQIDENCEALLKKINQSFEAVSVS